MLINLFNKLNKFSMVAGRLRSHVDISPRLISIRCDDERPPERSAHLPSAESEAIVPTEHGGFADPAAIQELRRILHAQTEAS